MPTSQVQFYSLDPAEQQSFAQQAAQLQRRQQLANALMQSGMTPLDTNRMSGRVAYRISPLEGLAKIAQAYVGAKESQAADAGMSELRSQAMDNMRRQMSGSNAAATEAPMSNDAGTAGSTRPDLLGRALREGAQSGSVGPTNDNAQRLASLLKEQGAQAAPQSQQAQSQPDRGQSPLNPLGLDPQIAAGYFMADPLDYFKTTVQQQQPTDYMKTVRASGLQPGSPQYQAAMRSNIHKSNYIAPTAIRPGGGVQDPRSGAITTLPSAPPTGFDSRQNPDGSWSYVPVRGGTEAITASTAATEAGRAPYQMVEGFDPNTKAPYRDYAGNSLPLPGAAKPSSPAAERGGQVSNALPRHAPSYNQGANLPPQNYTPESLRILQNERESARTPEDRAALDREIERVTPRVRTPGIQTGPALGESQGQTNAQNEMSAAWQKQQQAHQTAQTNIATLGQMRGLTDQAVMGYEAPRRQLLAQLGAFAGIPAMDKTATASDLFNKYGSQLIVGLSSKGLDTDAARALVESGSPNSKMRPEAAREAIDNLMSREQMAQARTQALQAYAERRDAAGYQGAASKFDKAADPRVWQWMGIQDPKARAAFAAKTMKADPSFATRVQDLESLGVINGAR